MSFSKIFLNADGGSRGNPGPSAVGVVVRDENRNKLEAYSECIGKATNNVSEYTALIKALELALKYTRFEVYVFMDSELVVKQMNGVYRVHKAHILELFHEVKKKEKEFHKVHYIHVFRSDIYQAEADRIVNEALDKETELKTEKKKQNKEKIDFPLYDGNQK